MLSKNKIKQIHALSRKKKRDEYRLFVAEGEKLVQDLRPYFELDALFSTKANISAAELISEAEMKKITHLASPSSLLAVFKQHKAEFEIDKLRGHLCLALDAIQDPGNLGTIIRVADWFGIRHVICSRDTVDIYNSKTVQSTMGALSRVSVYYQDLVDVFDAVKMPIYGTFMTGENIYESTLSTEGIIVMGNEGQGISTDLETKIEKRLTIPSFGDKSSESLNVAMATGIVCSEFRRRKEFL